MLGDDFVPTLDAAIAGGEWAWARIYKDLAPAVLGYLRGRGASEAEDVAGETFLQVVRDIASFEGNERAFRTWVFSIAHHRLLDESRYRSRRPVDPVASEILTSAQQVAEEEEDPLGSYLVARVRRFIDRLTPEQQDVLLLRLFGALTVDEVAAVVGKRRGAVKGLQRRALVRLRKELSDEPYPFE